VSVGPASRRRRNRIRNDPRVGSNVRRALKAPGGDARHRGELRGARAAIDEQVWERTMRGLRRIILLLSVSLASVIARMVIDGPKLLGGLTGALIVVLLLCSLALRRQGVRLQPGASSETERVDVRGCSERLPPSGLNQPPKDRSERSPRGWARPSMVIVAVEVHDNPDEQRYEAVVDGELAEVVRIVVELR
jgi:hypothetical protein